MSGRKLGLYAVITVAALFAGPAQAVTLLNSGGTHTINFFNSDAVSVTNATTLNVDPGGDIGLGSTAAGGGGFLFGATGVAADSGSVINVSGGTINGGGASGTLPGEFVVSGAGLALDNSSGTISGGAIIGGTATALSGIGANTVPGSGVSLTASTLLITGGSIVGGLAVDPDSAATSVGFSLAATGGSLIDLSGGFFGGDFFLSASVLNVFGTGLSFDGLTLAGTLLSGDVLSINVELDGGAQVNLNETPVVAMPAPGVLALFGFGLIGIALAGRHAT